MKIKITHTNQLQEPLDDDYTSFKLEELNQLEDSICTELYIGDVLDYCVNRNEALVMLIKKLRYGGTIVIHGVDICTMALQLYTGIINGQQATQMLYSGRQSASTMEDICSILRQCGLNILNISISQNIYSVTAHRQELA